MRKSIIAIGLVVALGASAALLLWNAPAGAQGGGTVVGEVKLNGTPPPPKTVKVNAGDVEFDAVVRIDTPGEADYYRNGGILQYVLRSLV